MMQDNKKARKIFYIIGIIPVIWLALIIAPITKGGIVNIVKNFDVAIANPFNIVWCESSLKTILIFLLIYFFCVLLYDSSIRT